MVITARLLVLPLTISTLVAFRPAPALAECRTVGKLASVKIDPRALAQLQSIDYDENAIFEALKRVSIPETAGCWGGATGDFDGQLLSAGASQWNLGQGTLQPLLRRFRDKFSQGFRAEVSRLMPVYGSRFFSDGCVNGDRRGQPTAECRNFILSQQEVDGRLKAAFKEEVDSLFESDAMIQIQVDEFVKTLTSVQSDLERLFPDRKPSALRVKWAIDQRVQQGFPPPSQVRAIRVRYGAASNQKRVLGNILLWYEGLCDSTLQEGIKLDCEYNIPAWRSVLARGLSDEQADLLLITHLKSRVATGGGGVYEALCFERRATIIFGKGSVAGREIGGSDSSVVAQFP